MTIVDEDAAGTLQFESATYSVNEDGTAVDVTVTRAGGTDGEVTVDVVVTGGDAAGGGTDYTFAPPTLTWIAGDGTSKTFSIPITDDSFIETNETIELTLQNATGSAAIGAPARRRHAAHDGARTCAPRPRESRGR